MPDFIVMGAVKAGTTSLYHYLGQHPEIRMSRENWPRFFHVDGAEPDFGQLAMRFGDALAAESQWRFRLMCHARVPRSLEGYEQLWPAGDQRRLRGEVSPTYLHDPDVPARIRRRFPGIRLVAVLRQPAERAYSHFVMDVSRGWVPDRDFVQALRKEPLQIDSFWWGLRHYLRHGFYAPRIRHLLALFRREQVLVCFYDDYRAAPLQFMRALFRFLGVDEDFPVDMSKRHNQGLIQVRHSSPTEPGQERIELVKPPPLPEQLRRDITAVFRPDILDLQQLTGRDLSTWLG